jgi:hypothetical protein
MRLIVIDNDIQQVISVQPAPLRIEDAPQPGGPWVKMTVSDRIEAMIAAKFGGAYADAVEMQRLGYAVGYF